MIIAIDLDGVISEELQTFSRSLARPLPGAIEGMQVLRDNGHRVIIYTGRSWAEYEMTKDWLSTHCIPHDELIMGKPIVDKFIDDRAIHFTTWPSVIKEVGPHRKPDDLLSEHSLRIIRETAAGFIRQIARRPDLFGPVLDVGPMWSGSGVFKKYPEYFVDARLLIEARGFVYETIDISPDASPTFVGDFTAGIEILPACKYGAVILNHCVEHMPRLFDVPRVVYHILKPGGLAFFATPWNFRFHGPRPDCWRISDDGYVALIDMVEGLEIVSVEKNQIANQPLHPASIHCIVRKTH